MAESFGGKKKQKFYYISTFLKELSVRARFEANVVKSTAEIH